MPALADARAFAQQQHVVEAVAAHMEEAPPPTADSKEEVKAAAQLKGLLGKLRAAMADAAARLNQEAAALGAGSKLE